VNNIVQTFYQSQHETTVGKQLYNGGTQIWLNSCLINCKSLRYLWLSFQWFNIFISKYIFLMKKLMNKDTELQMYFLWQKIEQLQEIKRMDEMIKEVGT